MGSNPKSARTGADATARRPEPDAQRSLPALPARACLRRRPRGLVVAGLGILCALAACGPDAARTDGKDATPAVASTGQVAPAARPRVSFYAASRFADQASFGPTAELVAELQAKGFEQWIDEQLALPAPQIDLAPVNFNHRLPTDDELAYPRTQFANLVLRSPAQLLLRLSWSLQQFLVVGDAVTDPDAQVVWLNLLTAQGSGSYRELLRAVSLNPAMGQNLDNVRNRPKSDDCPTCAPNENYARELMQLFSIGPYRLGDDGREQRDAQGRLLETYTQKDVAELARALTGWQYHFVPLPGNDWATHITPMVPSTLPHERDSGRKVVLGRVLPAGVDAARELDAVVELLVAHPNAGPFVAVRMIRQLVASNPSPDYVRRVASVFRNNGKGVAGDMKAVVRAVLLDPEARAGDDPTRPASVLGKYREPYLWTYAVLRGIGCQRALRRVPNPDNPYTFMATRQEPAEQDSVFGFYSFDHLAAGTRLPAPEAALVTGDELALRSVALNHWNTDFDRSGPQGNLDDAGCDLSALERAYARSADDFGNELARRWFRGQLPVRLRQQLPALMQLADAPGDRRAAMLRVLGHVLVAPQFGVQR